MYVTKQFILSHISQEDIFLKYFGGYDTKNSYRNPFRNDKNAKCFMKYYKGSVYNVLRFCDLSAKSKLCIDCFDFVMMRYSLSFIEALKKIAYDFGLDKVYTGEATRASYGNSVKIKTEAENEIVKKHLKVVKRPLNNYEIRFWKQFKSTISFKDLNMAGIYGVKSAYITNGSDYTMINAKRGETIFLYILERSTNQIQLYKPSRFIRNNKHLNDTNRLIFKSDTLDRKLNYCVIVKSYKCWTLSKIVLKENTLCSIAETVPTNDLDIHLIKSLFEDFDYVFTLFDNDKAGKVCSIEYKNLFGTIPLLFPKDMKKDLSDNLKDGKEQEVKNIIESLKKRYNI
jgi:hypothetical protein